jgi:hypothetical protein
MPPEKLWARGARAYHSILSDSPLLQGAYFILRSNLSHLASSALKTYYFFFFDLTFFFTTLLVDFLAMVDLFYLGCLVSEN